MANCIVIMEGKRKSRKTSSTDRLCIDIDGGQCRGTLRKVILLYKEPYAESTYYRPTYFVPGTIQMRRVDTKSNKDDPDSARHPHPQPCRARLVGRHIPAPTAPPPSPAPPPPPPSTERVFRFPSTQHTTGTQSLAERYIIHRPAVNHPESSAAEKRARAHCFTNEERGSDSGARIESPSAIPA